MMTPGDLDEYLRVARRHGVLRLVMGDVQIDVHPSVAVQAGAPADETPEESRTRKAKEDDELLYRSAQ